MSTTLKSTAPTVRYPKPCRASELAEWIAESVADEANFNQRADENGYTEASASLSKNLTIIATLFPGETPPPEITIGDVAVVRDDEVQAGGTVKSWLWDMAFELVNVETNAHGFPVATYVLS